MLHKTKGIVFNHIKYKESSIIAKIFTEELGLQSYIINGIRSQRSKGKIALFQPFTLLDLVVYQNNSKGIQRISEYKCYSPFQSIPFEIRKTTIAIFLSEVLSKCIKTDETEEGLFSFIQDSIQVFDQLDEHYENFHLRFLYQLMEYLGIQPDNIPQVYEEIVDDIHFKQEEILDLNELKTFEETLLLSYGKTKDLPSNLRRKFLYVLNDYYRLHIDSFGNLNSIKVLNEVFH